MNTLRGSGLNGLRGIEASRGKYIRPLIEIPRDEIEKYCEENKINPRHDESNDDNTYTCNKIRNVIIPYLKREFNPNIINTMNRLSEIVKEEEDFVEEETKKKFEEIIISEEPEKIEFNVSKFNNQEKVIQKRLIMQAITVVAGSTQGIERINLEEIIKLCNNNIGNKFTRPTKNVEIGIKNKRIYIQKVI